MSEPFAPCRRTVTGHRCDGGSLPSHRLVLPGRRTVLGWASLLCVAFSWTAFAGVATGQTTLQDSADVSLNDGVPRQVRDVGVDQNVGGKIATNLPLTDSEGRSVKTGYFFDGSKPTIVTLNYSSCPMLCSVQLNALVRSLRDLDLQVGEDFNILTISIDPNETIDKLAEMKSNYINQITSAQPDAAKGWAFCRTSDPVIKRIADSLGFRYTHDRRSGEYYHAAMLAFVSPDGVISRYSLHVNFPVNDLRKALVEAGDGTVGSVIDQAILLCFAFDPDANSYTLVGRKIMYFGGMIFAGGFFAMLLPFWIGRRGRVPQVDADDDGVPHSLDETAAPASQTKQVNLFS